MSFHSTSATALLPEADDLPKFVEPAENLCPMGQVLPANERQAQTVDKWAACGMTEPISERGEWLPSPIEIAEEAAAIRSEWDQRETSRRRRSILPGERDEREERFAAVNVPADEADEFDLWN